jgi:hypothetical protein
MVQAAGDVPPEAMARMTAAEARLYPLAMVDPSRYERATALVGLVAAELRQSCRRVDEVLARREELLAALPRLADDSGVGMADLVPADVVDAASALVCRQLQAHGAAAVWHARIDEARRAGREWLVVEPDPMAVMAGVHRNVELHLPTGSAVVSTVEAATAGGTATYRLELVPAAVTVPEGDAAPAPGPVRVQAQVFTDREQWQAAVERLKAELASGP